MGRWYVIADTPFLSEHDYVGSYDEWTLRDDGTIHDKYLGRRHGFDQPATGSDFVAKVMSGTGNTKWRVGLIWPFEVVVVIAYVDPEYRYTIRCMADGSMVWVLSRTPAMDEAVYADMLDRLSGMGFHIDRLAGFHKARSKSVYPVFSEGVNEIGFVRTKRNAQSSDQGRPTASRRDRANRRTDCFSTFHARSRFPGTRP